MPIYCDRCECRIDREEERSRIADMDLCEYCAGPIMREQRDEALNEIQRVTQGAPDPVLKEWVRITLERHLETIEASGHNDYGTGAWILATLARGFGLCSEELQDKFSAHPLPLVDGGGEMIHICLQHTMREQGWKIVQTGGGCTAWSKTINDHAVLITDNASSDLGDLHDKNEESWWAFQIGEEIVGGSSNCDGYVSFTVDTDDAADCPDVYVTKDNVQLLRHMLAYIDNVCEEIGSPKPWYTEIMEAAGFTEESTGGGCTAWHNAIDDDTSVWIYSGDGGGSHELSEIGNSANFGWGGQVEHEGGHAFHLFGDVNESVIKFHSDVKNDRKIHMPMVEFEKTHLYDSPGMLRQFIDYVVGAGLQYHGYLN